jgi:hypothetical protein
MQSTGTRDQWEKPVLGEVVLSTRESLLERMKDSQRASVIVLAAKSTCALHTCDLCFLHPVSILTLAKCVCSCSASKRTSKSILSTNEIWDLLPVYCLLKGGK